MASCCSWELSFPGRGTDPVKSLFCHRNLFFIAAETLKFFIASLPSVAVVNASPAKSHFPLLQAEIRGVAAGIAALRSLCFLPPPGQGWRCRRCNVSCCRPQDEPAPLSHLAAETGHADLKRSRLSRMFNGKGGTSHLWCTLPGAWTARNQRGDLRVVSRGRK